MWGNRIVGPRRRRSHHHVPRRPLLGARGALVLRRLVARVRRDAAVLHLRRDARGGARPAAGRDHRHAANPRRRRGHGHALAAGAEAGAGCAAHAARPERADARPRETEAGAGGRHVRARRRAGAAARRRLLRRGGVVGLAVLLPAASGLCASSCASCGRRLRPRDGLAPAEAAADPASRRPSTARPRSTSSGLPTRPARARAPHLQPWNAQQCALAICGEGPGTAQPARELPPPPTAGHAALAALLQVAINRRAVDGGPRCSARCRSSTPPSACGSSARKGQGEVP